jgi:hypothetical protein
MQLNLITHLFFLKWSKLSYRWINEDNFNSQTIMISTDIFKKHRQSLKALSNFKNPLQNIQREVGCETANILLIFFSTVKLI